MAHLASDLKKKVEEISNAKTLVTEILSTFDHEKKKHEKLLEMMKTFSVSDSEIVTFNVGGQTFATYYSTLGKRIRNFSNDPKDPYERNLLQGLASSLVQTTRDKNDAIFLDRDPKYFQAILNFLRTIGSPLEKFDLPENKHELEGLLKEASYFKIQSLVDLVWQTFSFDTSIVTSKKHVGELMGLCNLRLSSELRLVYRGSRDGFSASHFHSKCDNIPKTLTIVKSANGNIFGGYVGQAWDETELGYKDPTAFLFSLVNKENSPLKFNAKHGATTIYCKSGNGPIFGSGYDLSIADKANRNQNSYADLGVSFAFSKYAAKSPQSQDFLAGSYYFQVADIEVFSLKN